ncbi:MAG: tetratricopeptide repeat protein [Limisphaerales bacterium]
MKPAVKVALYVVTIALTIVFGVLAARHRPRERPPETVTEELAPEQEPVAMQSRAAALNPGYGRFITFGLLALVSLAGAGLLTGRDLSAYFAEKTLKTLYHDEGIELEQAEYEEAEKLWADGKHLEAIQSLRDHLKAHPRALHAQIRIAEIYEKDLNNSLAAVLEYEEVLAHKFDPPLWGRTAIRLVNLYNRMEKGDQAVALLQQILVNAPDTPAGAKARERLESSGLLAAEPEAAAEPPPAEEGGLPPGFRPKKG